MRRCRCLLSLVPRSDRRRLRDRVAGGTGKDVLKGGGGIDTVVGGPGRDKCKGDETVDRFGSCEG